VVGSLFVWGGCAQPADHGAPVQKLTSVSGSSSGASGTGSVDTTVVPVKPPPVACTPDDPVIARINGQPVTKQDLVKPLIEAHGLQMLVGLVQLDLLKQEARENHIVVGPEDVQHEYDLTLEKMFKDAGQKEQDQLDRALARGQTENVEKVRKQIRADRETLLTEYLTNQHFSRTEFNLKVEINTYLRKDAARLLQGKITDEMVEKQFGVEYGETAEVRYIQLANMQEVAEARRRLAAGEEFATVAETMSRNANTAALGGRLGAFSRQSTGLPDSFKDLAFSLQEGQVSETLSYGGNFFIIKLEKKHPPKAIKFDKVKDSLRKSMSDRLVQSLVEQLGGRLGQSVLSKLQIDDPELKKQFDEFQAQQQSAFRDKQKLDEQLRKERAAGVGGMLPTTLPATTSPSAAPTTEPAAGATAPATAPAAQP